MRKKRENRNDLVSLRITGYFHCMHRKLIFVPRRIDIITLSIDKEKLLSKFIHGIYRSTQQIYIYIQNRVSINIEQIALIAVHSFYSID
jgi:hypothetical protein